MTTETTAPSAETKVLQLSLASSDVRLVLEALGALPYSRVYQLVDVLHRQLETQLSSTAHATPFHRTHLEALPLLR